MNKLNAREGSLTGALFIVVFIILSGCSGKDTSNGGGYVDEIDANSTLISGSIDNVPESYGYWIWGDSVNKLCQQWSLNIPGASGWFYGTDSLTSTVDVYVLKAPSNRLTVNNAESFEYTTGTVKAFEGDTVFFRGNNGYYGAWYIKNIEGDTLTGTWYFQTNGGGDFTGGIKLADTEIYNGYCSNGQIY